MTSELTEYQQRKIREFRLQGVGYRAIASVVGVNRDEVRNFCVSKELDRLAAERNGREKLAQDESNCANCAVIIRHSRTGRHKKFCSEKCRRAWWSAHPDVLVKSEAASYACTCRYCHESFEAYGNRNRKYCSHNCYIRDRFWRKEEGREAYQPVKKETA